VRTLGSSPEADVDSKTTATRLSRLRAPLEIPAK